MYLSHKLEFHEGIFKVLDFLLFLCLKLQSKLTIYNFLLRMGKITKPKHLNNITYFYVIMEIISKVSKGTRMDQIYIPKRRIGFGVGAYVVVMPLEKTEKKAIEKPFFYNIDFLEPIKIGIINEIFRNIDEEASKYDNIIITGSFLEKGFNFNDIDIVLISEYNIQKNYLEELLEKKTGIKVHVIAINNKTFIRGLSSDPLYQTMLSRCVSKKRFVYHIKPKINYKILDMHLLKSKMLMENFDILTGKEKYEMLRNAVSIALFIDNKEVSKEKVDEHINKLFGNGMNKKIRENMVKEDFLDRYKKFYKVLSAKILEGIKNGSKQE